MLHSPPNPGIQASTTALARAFPFVAIDGSLGVIESHTLTVESADPKGGVLWVLVQELPTGLAPRLISRRAYEALRGGELTAAGLVYDGRIWQLSDFWDGKRLIAELIPA